MEYYRLGVVGEKPIDNFSFRVLFYFTIFAAQHRAQKLGKWISTASNASTQEYS